MADLEVLTSEPPGQEVIAKLEAVLEMARAGNISSVAIAWVERDGTINRSWSKMPSYGALLGSVARLAHLLNLHIDR